MPPEKIPEALRLQVEERAKNYCEYCYYPSQISSQRLTIDHIKPRKSGGKTELDNLALCCSGCNVHKQKKTHSIDPETGQVVALLDPRQQVWTEHFEWSNDLISMIGKTDCGRATVIALHMNRANLITARFELMKLELHPPPKSLLKL